MSGEHCRFLPQARTGIVVVRVVHGTRDLPTLFS
jgi:hypothetical protein